MKKRGGSDSRGQKVKEQVVGIKRTEGETEREGGEKKAKEKGENRKGRNVVDDKKEVK